MPTQTLITLNDASLAFGHHALLDHANLTIQEGERVGLIGRNGAGKSSLLRLLDGRFEADDGEVSRLNGLRAITVEQEPQLHLQSSVFDCVVGDYISQEDWARPARANDVLAQLNLDPQATIGELSGGTRKRIALAKALIEQPDLLLLDEPTNHLDFEGIQWLEQMLQQASFACVVITHDRRFLDAVAQRIIELDRGQLFSFPGNFSQWQIRKAEWLEAEQQHNQRFDKLLAQEEVWIRKGIEARRTRNEGRVRQLQRLRLERQARRDSLGQVNFNIDASERSGKLVAELVNVSKAFGEKIIIRNYSTTIIRGDRIGLIGPNGAGKSTLLKIILGLLVPDSGTVKLGTHLNIAYFDQMRDQLDENASLCEVINPGSEWVEIGNQRKHVMSYLGDFLFSPARAQSPVSSLSGGERARLLLARLFARPANVLVMDEPTNDLDIETLELLEDLLQNYAGTVLLVSHDRAFLDNVITSTIAFEGNGQWHDYVGGYADWLAQTQSTQIQPKEKPSLPTAPKTASDARQPRRSGKISTWEQKELAEIPDKIAALEQQQNELSELLSKPDLYTQGVEKADSIQRQLTQINEQLEQLFERWETLENKQNSQN